MGDRRGERPADDCSQSVGDGHSAEPDRGREEFDVQGGLRTVREPEPDREDTQCQVQQAEIAGIDEPEQREGSDDQDDESDDVGLYPSDAIGQHSRSRSGDQPDERSERDGQKHIRLVEADGVGRILRDESAGRHVSAGVVAGEDQCGDEDQRQVLLEENEDRGLALCGFGVHLLEHRGVFYCTSHPVADTDEHDGQQERDSPTPFHEGLARRDDAGHQRDHTGGQQHSQGDAELRVRSGSSTFADIGMFDGEERGASPLSACRETLDDAQQDEQYRCSDADGLVRGNESDQGGRHTHRDEGDDEDSSASEPVAKVPRQECPQRAEEERNADGGESQHLPDALPRRREVEMRENECCRC